MRHRQLRDGGGGGDRRLVVGMKGLEVRGRETNKWKKQLGNSNLYVRGRKEDEEVEGMRCLVIDTKEQGHRFTHVSVTLRPALP